MSNFEKYEVQLSGRKWNMAKVLLSPDAHELALARKQATEKSKYTMPYSQAGVVRDDKTKFQRQFMGCLAEIFSQQYLDECLVENGYDKKYFIRRYDDVRTDGFKNAADEYDLHLVHSRTGMSYKIECRSSVVYNRSLLKAIEEFDIIGPYSSSAKESESYSHIYIRPLYEVIAEQQKNYDPNDFEKLIVNGGIHLYIAGGCFRKDMIEKGYQKSMRQGDTRYQVVKLTNGYDAVDFKNELKERISLL